MAGRIAMLMLSCIAAPVIAASLGALTYAIGDQHIGTYFRLGWFGVALFGGGMGFIVGVPAMVLIGLPLHAYYQRRGSTDIGSYAAGGAYVGFLAAMALILPSWRWPIEGSSVKLILVGIGTGIIAACLFWLLWRARRTQPNPHTSAS